MAKRIRMAAQAQSLVMALATQATEPLTVDAVAHHSEAQRLGIFTHHVQSAMKSLIAVQRLVKVRLFQGRTRWGYELSPAARQLLPKAEPAPVVPQVIALPDGCDVKLDFIKETRRLRIEFSGLRLELGVVEQ